MNDVKVSCMMNLQDDRKSRIDNIWQITQTIGEIGTDNRGVYVCPNMVRLSGVILTGVAYFKVDYKWHFLFVDFQTQTIDGPFLYDDLHKADGWVKGIPL